MEFGDNGPERMAPAGDMPEAEFRKSGGMVLDWIARYLEGADRYPVLAQVSPGEIKGNLPTQPPESGESMEQILRDFEDLILPGITHWNHPAFHAYFAITGSAPGILGEMLASALNVNAMVWRSSPAGTELEELTLEWLRGLLGLPAFFDGTINDTASSSSLYAMAAAREAKLPEAWEKGLSGIRRGRFYASDQAHSSIDKAAITLGFGREGVRRVASDEAFRLRPDALRAAIREDLENGIVPVGAVATLGTTSTTSVDPVETMAAIAREFDLWLHVDAAYGGPAAMVPELRPLFTGWEKADSIVVNPHKWLFTPIDCSVLYVRDSEQLKRAFSLTPEYLRTSEQELARNLMDYGVALGRRFRSLKLWFVMRYFGAEGMRERIRQHVEMAREVAAWIDAEPQWERVAPVPFSTVVFRYRPGGVDPEAQDGLNRAIMDQVNATGNVFLSHTVLNGRFCLRLALGNLKTRWEHLERSWELLRTAAESAAPPG
ncbi:MAG: pyridoxal phosphate-dependent decarboxylase family protein [Longimicrobiales bacterium]